MIRHSDVGDFEPEFMILSLPALKCSTLLAFLLADNGIGSYDGR